MIVGDQHTDLAARRYLLSGFGCHDALAPEGFVMEPPLIG